MNCITKLEILKEEKKGLDELAQKAKRSLIGTVATYKPNGKRYVFTKDERIDATKRVYCLKNLEAGTYPDMLFYYSDEDILYSLSFEGDKEYVNSVNAQISLNKIEEEIKHIEEKVLPRLKEIEYLKSRGVQHLIHFTRVENINSISKYGIVPVDMQNELGITSKRTDNIRRDGTQHNNLSISYPNSGMLNAKIDYAGMHLAILKISLDALLDENLIDKIIYSDHNAAYFGSHKGEGLESLSKLFSEETYYDGKRILRNKDIPDDYTTDSQAEVLISGVIPVEYIEEIHIKQSDVDSLIIVSKSPLWSITKTDNRLFEHRVDENTWKRSRTNGYQTGICGFTNQTIFCA